MSIAMKHLPSSSKRTSTLSRVVPGISLTIIRSALASELMNVLLPTLRRPTMATFISGSAEASAASSSSGGGKWETIMFEQHRPDCDSVCVLMRSGLPQPRR